MSDDALLQALADAAGIEPRFWDISGRRYERNVATARHLLHALRIPCDSDSDIKQSLKDLEMASWKEPVSSVVIGYENEPLRVPVHPERLGRNLQLQWYLALENGTKLEGEAKLESLPVLERRTVDGQTVSLCLLEVPAQPLGYHKLRLSGECAALTNLIVAPRHCYLPRPTSRFWGISAQIYSLRSAYDKGMGDFRDLRALVEWAARERADFVAVNPLHALFWDAPQDASPYCPSSRQFINALYLDVEAIADRAEVELSQSSHGLAAGTGARDGEQLVDYPTAAAKKFSKLREAFRIFEDQHWSSQDERALAFNQFRKEHGPDLTSFATFQAISARQHSHDWRRWPSGLRNHKSSEVESFKREHEREIHFFEYLQWQSELQLTDIARRANSRSMALGLYADLAVGVDASSADHWGDQSAFLADLSIGAPPDPFNERGQQWGVVAFDPRQLQATGYNRFRTMLSANMRWAGALRVDHVMGWERLFVIPVGGEAAEGAYLRYPLHDMLAIAALESQRNRCMVIGEDLGTVRQGFREEMAQASILSYRVLYFEKEHDEFRRPSALPQLAVASATTHDLATLRGFWTSQDIALKARLGIIRPGAEEAEIRRRRECDKRQLLEALRGEGLWPTDTPASGDVPWSSPLATAIHAYLSKSPCMMVAVQLDDLVLEQNQVNLPGTSTEYPNWRRRLSRTLEEIAADTEIGDALSMIDRLRKAY